MQFSSWGLGEASQQWKRKARAKVYVLDVEVYFLVNVYEIKGIARTATRPTLPVICIPVPVAPVQLGTPVTLCPGHCHQLARLALGVVCVGLFLTPAFLVSRGWTVAGDKQKEAQADIAAISPQTVQHNVPTLMLVPAS